MAEPIGMLDDAHNELRNVLATKESNNPYILDLNAETVTNEKLFDEMNAENSVHSNPENLNVPKQDNYISPEHAVNPSNNEIVVIMRAGEQLEYQRSAFLQTDFELAA